MSEFGTLRECLDNYLREVRSEGQSELITMAERTAFLIGVISAIGLYNEGIGDVALQAERLLQELRDGPFFDAVRKGSA